MTGEVTADAPIDRADAPADRITRLFTQHQRRLYLLARRLSPHADDALEMVQETFLRAARASGGIPEDAGAEEAWLVRVLVNLYRDRWRQRADRKRLGALLGPAPRETRPDPDSPLIARVLVWRALLKLAPRRRAVVVLREIEGASVGDIARLLGIAAVTVRWHLSRARQDLRRILGVKP